MLTLIIILNIISVATLTLAGIAVLVLILNSGPRKRIFQRYFMSFRRNKNEAFQDKTESDNSLK